MKIISLDNLFSSDNVVSNNAIDISLVKPLTQEYVFDTLIELYDKKKEKVETALEAVSPEKEKNTLLDSP
ncbi:MAG: hypothetical protein FAF03_08195 [Epsilonproteobacteria bacterium]|nr:hypothetical protein [Campylobacterota bacterium]